MWSKTFFKDTTSNQHVGIGLCCSRLLVPKKVKNIVAMSYTVYIYYLEPVKLDPSESKSRSWFRIIMNHPKDMYILYVYVYIYKYITILVGRWFRVPGMSERIKKVPPFPIIFKSSRYFGFSFVSQNELPWKTFSPKDLRKKNIPSLKPTNLP